MVPGACHPVNVRDPLAIDLSRHDEGARVAAIAELGLDTDLENLAADGAHHEVVDRRRRPLLPLRLA